MPEGASGSSAIRARLVVPGGTLVHLSGGEMFLPSHVYFTGMGPPSEKAELTSSSWLGLVESAADEIVTLIAITSHDDRTRNRPAKQALAFMDKLTSTQTSRQMSLLPQALQSELIEQFQE